MVNNLFFLLINPFDEFPENSGLDTFANDVLHNTRTNKEEIIF